MTDIPSTIAGYKIGAQLGQGGFGTVYRATHSELGREDAIKILREEHCRDSSAITRFTAEARAASRIAHPGIVRIYDIGELADGRSYCVMELLHGRTLRQILDERGHLPLEEAQVLLGKVAAAVDAAHAAEVAHRDLKPENLFIEPDGSIRLIDFGLAKLTKAAPLTTTGRVMGSPRYMSPEQCRGRGADARSDLYSFGALAYHVLVGEPPFAGDALALALHHLNDPPPPPSSRRAGLSKHVDDVLLALLDKDPNKRPRPLVMVVDSLTSSAPLAVRRRRWPYIAGGSVAVGCITAMVLFRHHDPPVKRSEPLVEIDHMDFDHREQSFLDPNGFVIAVSATTMKRVDPKTHVATEVAADAPINIGNGFTVAVVDQKAVVVDPSGRRTPLDAAPNFDISPDMKSLSYFGDGTALKIVTIASGTIRSIETNTPHLANAIPNWSPDGARVIWGAPGAIEITNVADGATTEVNVPRLAESNAAAPAAFVDNAHFAYCASEGRHTSIKIRSLATIGDAGKEFRALDPRVADCLWSRSNGKVLVSLAYGRRLAGILDLRTNRAIAIAPVFEGFPESLDANGSQITIRSGAKIDGLDVATKARAPLHCPGMLRKMTGETTYFSLPGAKLVIADAECKTLGEWSLPGPSTEPRCRAGVCVIAAPTRTGSTAALTIWSLAPHGALDVIGTIATTAPGGTLDLSPDGKRLAVAPADGSNTISMWSSLGGPAKRIKLGGLVQTLVWGSDPERPIVFEWNPADGTTKAVSVGLDGVERDVWSKPGTSFVGVSRDASGDRILGVMNEPATGMILFALPN